MKNRATSYSQCKSKTLNANLSNYRVEPVKAVRKEAEKLLNETERKEAITLVNKLSFYPNIGQLSICPCGLGYELRVTTPATNRRGWLRVIFSVEESQKTIKIVHLFWKKTNKIRTQDIQRANARISQLAA